MSKFFGTSWLIIDIGNTSISFALYEFNKIQVFCKLGTRRDLSFKELYDFLKCKFDCKVDKVFVSSVVPVIDKVFMNVIVSIYKINPLFIRFDLNYNLSFNLYNNRRFVLGSDVFANLVGAIEFYNVNDALVVDLGTACTIFAISREEGILGGLINGGPFTSLNSLVHSAYLLKNFNLTVPKELLGISTIDSVNSGVIYQYKYLIEGVYYELVRDYDRAFKLIITGGNSYLILPLISIDFIHNLYLTIEGIRILGNAFKGDY
ncbi:type III pantothenate kinase [Borrelia miyamotoi]|uniref:Type III pantothenate kinase n=1 Tax=Borrelia miyamotoi TaxID=47466 RepID=A0AAX3JLW4_9SPIR|nr:type III pantothenate kinase [Borrelia miyamotoi]QFP41825.1 type III pantothenate kinase [Borrelia miyamotoi]QFP47945.1 type III pantothenate kinase [Borrelia miyamotoi]QGT55704.1 type III pantothenate kinase [Borrelia miyamotoi]QGT56486.1 type III pantothenate kinase [Borrelia miyamotoi]WAZ71733.1 type III pantothenate kinase [Borrelia miyamotoi]